MDKRISERDAKHRYWVTEALKRLEYDINSEVRRKRRIPEEWHNLAAGVPSKRVKVTMMVEQDVVKFFKSLGPGYQARMNDVMRAFMHMKLGRLLQGVDTPEGYLEDLPPERVSFGKLMEMSDRAEEMLRALK